MIVLIYGFNAKGAICDISCMWIGKYRTGHDVKDFQQFSTDQSLYNKLWSQAVWKRDGVRIARSGVSLT